MSVRLRLTRIGRRKRPYYRIVAVDSRKKRDGSYLEGLGTYQPLEKANQVALDGEKALKWLRTGAQPSDTVRSLLRKEGVWLRFRLEKRGLPEVQIEELMAAWFAKNRQAVPAPVAKPVAPEPATEVSPPIEAEVSPAAEDVETGSEEA